MSDFFTIQWQADHLLMIDQRKLPHEEIYLKCENHDDVSEAIQKMVIRGAPAIGVAAAMGVVLGVKKSNAKNRNDFEIEFLKIYDTLYRSRPTAINLRWALDCMKVSFYESLSEGIDKVKERLEQEALRIYEEDIQINQAMAGHGEPLIQEGFQLLTYCNTGALATAGYGTALGVIRKAHRSGKKIHVYVSETRPYFQGLRLTSWECWKEGIPHTVIADNMAASLMSQQKIDAVFVGADRVARNGDVANKIGTYSLAVLAKHHDIPFYVVAPTSTIDRTCETGSEIPIEERDPKEITHFRNEAVGLEGISVYNPAFDITPHPLITAIITEKGIFHPVIPLIQ